MGQKQSKQMPDIANIWPWIPSYESGLPIPAAAEELRGTCEHSGELRHPLLTGPVQPPQLALSYTLVKEKEQKFSQEKFKTKDNS